MTIVKGIEQVTDPGLRSALHRFGTSVADRAAKRARREARRSGHPGPNTRNRYERHSPEQVQAAKELADRITAEHELPPAATLEPYQSEEDKLTERLKRVPPAETSLMRQLKFPFAA